MADLPQLPCGTRLRLASINPKVGRTCRPIDSESVVDIAVFLST
jgi:hypothetical protein